MRHFMQFMEQNIELVVYAKHCKQFKMLIVGEMMHYALLSCANILLLLNRYTTAGSSSDWFKSIGVDYSYAIELRDYGLFGFLLPAYQIIPTSQEIWAGMRASLTEVRANVIHRRKKHQHLHS